MVIHNVKDAHPVDSTAVVIRAREVINKMYSMVLTHRPDSNELPELKSKLPFISPFDALHIAPMFEVSLLYFNNRDHFDGGVWN